MQLEALLYGAKYWATKEQEARSYVAAVCILRCKNQAISFDTFRAHIKGLRVQEK